MNWDSASTSAPADKNAPPRSPRGFWRATAAGFRYAFGGAWHLLARERNARIHAAATIAVILAGVWLQVSRVEWCFLAIAIGLVWIAEAFNTAFELLADAAVPERHPWSVS